VRSPPEERARRAHGQGEGCGGYRGRSGLADCADMRGGGKGEGHSGASGAGWGPEDRTGRTARRRKAATMLRLRSPNLAPFGRKGQESCWLWVRLVAPRARGQAGDRKIVASGGAGGSAAASETSQARLARATVGDRRRTIRKAASGRKGREFRWLRVRPVFPRAFGRTPAEPSSLIVSRNFTLFATLTPPRSAPFTPRAAPPVPHRSPCPISRTPRAATVC
jgi:hypothetical protein